MKIVVAGLGGVGGVVGGRLAMGLADSEHQVIFWCRGNTLNAIRDRGLEVVCTEGDLILHPTLATDRVEDVKSADLILFATKNYHLEAAAAELAPAVTGKTVLIPLLNGVSAVSVLEKQIPQSDVLGGCIYVSAHVERPGVVRQVGAVQRILFGKKGLSDAENLTRYGAVDQVLKKSGINVTLTGRIDVEMWAKLVFLSPFAGVTTLFRRSISEVLSQDDSFNIAKQLISEIEALARAKNIDLPANIADLTIEKARSFALFTKTSMQIDQENDRQTELESLIGYICKEAHAAGVPVPTYDSVYGDLKPICKV